MIGGRAAWNIVTSVNDGEAHNMGSHTHMEHDLRYDRADEFMEIVLGHWDGWEDDALVVDKASGLFAHPDKVHRLDHEGQFLRSRGPVHRAALAAGPSGGDPGRLQPARQSVRGALGGDDVRGYADLASAQARIRGNEGGIAAPRAAIRTMSRINTIAYPVCAATCAEAEDKMAVIEAGYREVDGLSLLSEALNFDFTSKGIDEAFTDEELASMSGMQAMRDRVISTQTQPDPARLPGDHPPRPPARGDRGAARRRSPTGWKNGSSERGCDGYVIAGTHTPGTFEDFVRFVVPELQRRRLFQREYRGATLRENLGLARPARGWWKAGA